MSERLYRWLPKTAPYLFTIWVWLVITTLLGYTPQPILSFTTALVIIACVSWLAARFLERQQAQQLRDGMMADAPPIEVLDRSDPEHTATVRFRILRQRPSIDGKLYISSTAPVRQEIINDWTADRETVRQACLPPEHFPAGTATKLWEMARRVERKALAAESQDHEPRVSHGG